MPSATFLQVDNVKVKYFEKIIFENLNLTIDKEDHLAVVSKEESLASELLKVLLGNYPVVEGGIHYNFFGEFVEEHPPTDPLFNYRQLISLVSQKHAFKNLSNTSDFYYQQRYNSQDADDAPKVVDYLMHIEPARKGGWDWDKVLDTLKLRNLMEQHIIKLSNGETKRLLFAAALLKNPLLLLLDFPYTGLDASMREEMNEIIKKIILSGIKVIIATHPHEVPDSITDVIFIKDNKEVLKIKKSELKNDDLKQVPDAGKIDHLEALISHQKFIPFKTIVLLDEVTVRYDQKIILDKVSWKIAQGDRWALSGPNGAGKTTLLSLINGDNPQSYANKIVLFDRKRGTGESIWEIKDKIGFISPELFQFFPSGFTCFQVVESGLHDSIGLYRTSNTKHQTLARQWLEIFNIEEEGNLLFHETTSNSQRICLLARALIKQPSLLILDEPCQGLSTSQKKLFIGLIDLICTVSKTSLIYVTHYHEEIPSCVTKLLRLESGKVVYNGSI